jgi:hypothetical protein
MALSIVEAFDAPPLSTENACIRFDQGAEVRFLQNVFLPERESAAPQWIVISEISRTGMLVDAAVPMTIRTAPIYGKGDYRIEVRGKSDAAIETLHATAAWSRMLTFKFKPSGGDGPYRIEISATPGSDVAPPK